MKREDTTRGRNSETVSPEGRLAPSRVHPQQKQQQQIVVFESQPKSKSSPFLVDLAKDVARIEKESTVRHKGSTRRRLVSSRQIEEAKNNLILQAFQEGNELEALRWEKRKILEEERRLKTLIEIEKTNAHRKQDRQAAQRAERKRRHVKLEIRLKINREKLEDQRLAKGNLLVVKHQLKFSVNK